MNVPSCQADAGRGLRVVIAAPLGDEIGATPPTKSGFWALPLHALLYSSNALWFHALFTFLQDVQTILLAKFIERKV